MRVYGFFILVLFSYNSWAAEVMITGTTVNVRSSAEFSGESNVLRQVRAGERFSVVSEGENYVEISLADGSKGFVWKDFTEPMDGHDTNSQWQNDASAPAVSDKIGLPICGCSGCSKGSPFGIRRHPILRYRRLHAGCDLRAPVGTFVYASEAGKVVTAGRAGGYGKMVSIEHKGQLKDSSGQVVSSRGYTTNYAHLLKVLVSQGQVVKKGDKIGQVDSTGLSTGHHLHFEVSIAGRKVDPARLMNLNDIKRSCGSGSQQRPGSSTTRTTR